MNRTPGSSAPQNSQLDRSGKGISLATALSNLTLVAALGVSTWLRPDVTVGLVVLGAVFMALERRWPIRPQRAFRKGFMTDAVHFVVDQVLSGLLVGVLIVFLVPILEPLLPNLDFYLHGPARLLAAALIGELTGYWGHRMMHRVPWMWKLHAVHHSSPTMDWLAPNRRHALDTTFGQAASMLPLLALGLRPPEVISLFVVKRAQGLFVHANLRCRFPVIRWIVATPEFHHWHHSADPAHYDQNFAGQCPIVDWLFGTLHMPKNSWPEHYGIAIGHDPVPSGYLPRLAWPFRETVRTATPRRVAIVAFFSFVTLCGTAVVSAIEPPLGPQRFVCTASRLGTIEISPTGIVLKQLLQQDDRTSIRNVDFEFADGRPAAVSDPPSHRPSDPPSLYHYRVIRRSGAPLTLSILRSPSATAHDRFPFIADGPEGRLSGRCEELNR
jgi:sterol desaturase/sphingolipid hydroxylase (fatty acid hydroxylase superfamily)